MSEMKKTITRMLVGAVVVGTTGTVLAEKDFGDFCKPFKKFTGRFKIGKSL